MDEYEIGTSVQLHGVFKTPAGVVFDPTTVVCVVQDPSGVETTSTYGVDVLLLKDSTGTYSMWTLPTAAGRYAYKFRGTGPESISKSNTFIINPSPVVTP